MRPSVLPILVTLAALLAAPASFAAAPEAAVANRRALTPDDINAVKTVSDPQEKIKLWEEAKRLAIGRLIAAGYAFTLLMIAMKTQVIMLD